MLPFTDPDSWKSRWLRLFFLPLCLSFFRLSLVINNIPASRSVHFVSLFTPVLESFQPIFTSFVHNFRLPCFSDRNEKKINLISMKFIFSFAYPQPSAKASETVSRLHSDTYVEFVFHKICKLVKTFLNKPHCCVPCQ